MARRPPSKIHDPNGYEAYQTWEAIKSVAIIAFVVWLLSVGGCFT
jgi:hypothetical protein